MARGQLNDSLEYSPGCDGAPECENLGQGDGIKFGLDAGMFKKCFYFRSEQERVIQPCIEKRANANPVAGHEQLFLLVVPDGKYKLPVQPVQTICSIVQVGIQ